MTVPAHRTVLEVLREHLNLPGTKHGCELGECAACGVELDGEVVLSCLVVGVECKGRGVETIEGFADGARLRPLREAFADLGGSQCGCCTPAMPITACALLSRTARPSDDQIRDAHAANICRGSCRRPRLVAARRGEAPPPDPQMMTAPSWSRRPSVLMSGRAQLCQYAEQALGMHEGNALAACASDWRLVDERGATGTRVLQLGADVVGCKRNVMKALAALADELGDRAVRRRWLKQLDAHVSYVEERCPNLLARDLLDVPTAKAEDLFISRDREFERAHSYSDMINVCNHENYPFQENLK